MIENSQNSRLVWEKGFGTLQEVTVRNKGLSVEESRLKSTGPLQCMGSLGVHVLVLGTGIHMGSSWRNAPMGLRLCYLWVGIEGPSWVPGGWTSPSLMVDLS